MRSDENASSKKQGADMTADELLMLLNKSIEENKAEPKNINPANSGKSPSAELKIDDSVYKSAQDELRSADALNATDDSDLDIDALIDKYITSPREERAQEADGDSSEAKALEEIVRDVIRPTEPSDIAYEDSRFSEPQTVNADEDFEDAELDEEISDLEALDGITYDDDDDMKLAEATADEVTDVTLYEASQDNEAVLADEDMALDTQTTAVFDISRVKQITEDDDEEISRLVDEAFAMSETEVFTPVNADEVDAAAASADDDSSAQAVYGNPGDEEIDQTDLNIMIAFGMNDELKDAVGEEQATKIEDDILQKHEETAQMQAVAGKLEYTTRDQNTEILTNYKSQYYTIIIRLAAAVGLLAVMFLLENFSMLGMTLPKFMRPTSYPMVYAMIDLQLVVFSGVLVGKQVIDGVKNLIALKPTPESLTAFMLAASLIYTFIAGITAPVEGFGLYNLPVVFTVVLALMYEFMNLKRDVLSFNIVSSRKKKFVVTPVSDSTESLEREIFNDYISDDAQIIRVGKTDFVDGFFKRVSDNKISKPIIGIMIPIVMILSVAFLIFSFIKSGSAYESFTMAFLTVAVTTPLAAFVVYSYPFYKASKDSYENDSAIIGESSLGEYSGSAVISFEDKEVFPSGGVKVTSIKVYGKNRIDEIIYSLASAFIKIGGPLAEVFNQATHDLGHSDDVELVEVEDDGFTVTIDGVTAYLGKASYMEKKDFDTPYDNESRKQEQGSTGILYIAYEGQLAAKVYIQYTIDGEFESILSQLYKTGMCVGIKSFDPNIDDLLLAKKIKAMKYPVKVIRSKNVEDIPHTFERCDSGIVSKRSVKTLLRTVALCERVSSVIRTNMIVKVLAMLIGVVVMIFIHAFGGSSTLSSLYLMLYQLFWIIPVMIISRFLV